MESHNLFRGCLSIINQESDKKSGGAKSSPPLYRCLKNLVDYLINSTEPFFSYDSLGRDLVR